MTARRLNLNAPPYFPAGHFDAPLARSKAN